MLARNRGTEGLITRKRLITRGQIYAHPSPFSTQLKSVEVHVLTQLHISSISDVNEVFGQPLVTCMWLIMICEKKKNSNTLGKLCLTKVTLKSSRSILTR